MADDALTLLERSLEAYRADPAAVLDPDALVQAARILIAAVPEALRPSDNQDAWALALRAPATLHLLRARELGSDGDADAEAAATLFGIIQRTTPAAVPEPLRPAVADPARQDLISRTRGVIAWEHHIAVLDQAAASAGSVAVLAEVALLWTAALEQTPAGDPGRARYWARLAAAQVTRFELTGAPADLDAAIGLYRRALDADFSGAPGAAVRAGRQHRARGWFRRAGPAASPAEAAGPAEAVSPAEAIGRDETTGQAEAAGGGFATHDLARASILSGPCDALRLRPERTGSAADLDAAVEAGQAAIAVAAGHPHLAGHLSNLGLALRSRSIRTGSAADLDAAVAASQAATGLIGEDDPLRAAALSNLGLALRLRFERAGSAADLDAAVAAGRAAVAAAPDSDPRRARMLGNLSIALRRRAEQTGSLPDLDAAVGAGWAAVASTPDNDPSHATVAANLGNALIARFERAGSAADLDAAVEASQTAVAVTPADHPDRAIKLSNLGAVLLTRFNQGGDCADLDAAVAASRAALAATPKDHPNHRVIKGNLALMRRARAERNGPGGSVADTGPDGG